MDEDNGTSVHYNPRSLINIRFEKRDELNKFIENYQTIGKSIDLAVACGSTEMPNKIREQFESKVPATGQWISLDLLLTDSDSYRSGPHIRMDATNEQHWQQVVSYLKENDIEVGTVAFTAFGPDIESDLLQRTIMPIVKKGGFLVYPSYFLTNYTSNKSADFEIFDPMIGNRSRYYEDLSNYHSPKGKFYQNKEALIEEKVKCIEKTSTNKTQARIRFEAKVYINRIVFHNPALLKDVFWRDLFPYGLLEDNNFSFFLKTADEFTRDYITFFREYMSAIGFDPSSYKIYSKAFPNVYTKEDQAKLFGVEEYTYPQDGPVDLAGYDRPSLVLIKQ